MKPERGGDDRRNRGNRFGGPKNQEGGGPPRNPEDRINERLAAISGPTFELPQLDMSEKKFSGRNRLYIGNLTADMTEDDVTDMFKSYGETSELFINKEKNFGFIRLVIIQFLFVFSCCVHINYIELWNIIFI